MKVDSLMRSKWKSLFICLLCFLASRATAQTLKVLDQIANATGNVEVPLLLEQARGIITVSFVLNFDPAIVTFQELVKSELGQYFTLKYNQVAGSITVAMCRRYPLQEDVGELVRLIFKLNPGVPPQTTIPITIADFGISTNEEQGIEERFSLAFFSGEVRVGTGEFIAYNKKYIRAPGAYISIKISELATDTLGRRFWIDWIGPSQIGAIITVTNGCIYYQSTKDEPDQFEFRVKNEAGQLAQNTIIINVIPESGIASSIEFNVYQEVIIKFYGIPGYIYEVQRTQNLDFPQWSSMGEFQAAQDGLIVFTDEHPPALRGFYRLILKGKP